ANSALCIKDVLERAFALTFVKQDDILSVSHEGTLQGTKETLAPGERTRIGHPKGVLNETNEETNPPLRSRISD
ncbi:MAG TPA: hypothetical protein VNE38_13565, partial [Ktedonobacteraceae bacterium]|nr:hypothetical protein [Ktedonobacteraceae bacterium]